MNIDERLTSLEETAKQRIQNAIAKYGDDIAVACSFGKDSIVVLKLALEIDPEILVVWNNTLNEHPETIKFAKKIVKEWNLNFIENRPFVTFWDVVDEYGFPTPTNRHCCDYLKLYPVQFLYKDLGIRAAFTGLRRDESRSRENLPEEGPDTQIQDIYRYNPIVEWTELDIWNYHIQKNLPMNSLYMKGLKRTGCFYCTLGAGFGALKLFAELYPKRWIKLKKMLEEDKQFKPTKDGFFVTTKKFEKTPHTEKNLKQMVQKKLIKREKSGKVFRTSPNFNRTTNFPCGDFL